MAAVVRPLAALLGLALLALPALAQTPAKRTLVVRGVQMPAALVLVVDRSGSMNNGDKYARACFEAKCIAEQAGDGARVKFVSFAEDVEYFEGGRWIELPNAEALCLADAWMRSRNVYGMTNMTGAMGSVLEKEPGEAIGVVLVTDAEPTDSDGVIAAANAIVALNGKRATPAVVGVLSIDPSDENDRFGVVVAKGAGGSYVRTQRPK